MVIEKSSQLPQFKIDRMHFINVHRLLLMLRILQQIAHTFINHLW